MIELIKRLTPLVIVVTLLAWHGDAGEADIFLKHLGQSESWYIDTFGKDRMEVDLPYDQLLRLRAGNDFFYGLTWKGGYVANLDVKRVKLAALFPVKSRRFEIKLSVYFDGKSRRSFYYVLSVSYDAYGLFDGQMVALYMPKREFIDLVSRALGVRLQKISEWTSVIPSKVEEYAAKGADHVFLTMIDSLNDQFVEKNDQWRTFNLFVILRDWKNEYGRKKSDMPGLSQRYIPIAKGAY